MNCQAKAGLLVLRTCDEPSVGVCASCGIPLCAVHLMMGKCPDCAASPEVDERKSYYNTYGQPSQFGDKRYFTRNDAATAKAVEDQRNKKSKQFES